VARAIAFPRPPITDTKESPGAADCPAERVVTRSGHCRPGFGTGLVAGLPADGADDRPAGCDCADVPHHAGAVPLESAPGAATGRWPDWLQHRPHSAARKKPET